MLRKCLAAAALVVSLGTAAQTQVSDYRPGITTEGITYFLPATHVRVIFEVTRTHYEPGEFAPFAARFLRQTDVTTTPYDVWKIEQVSLVPYGVADSSKVYSIKLKAKTSAPLATLATDGRLLAVNTIVNYDTALPSASVTPVSDNDMHAANYKTAEILAAGSRAKMAELTANEIYDIRENRGLLLKGQADFMPKDGEQLNLMLANLQKQEDGLLQLFYGTQKVERHILVRDIYPTKDVADVILLNFSRHLGVVDNDDPAGTPILYAIKDLHTLPLSVPESGKSKSKKEVEDLRYVVPSRVKVSVYNGDEEWASQSFPMAQFGRVEHLGADLFNKKMDTEIILDPTTGGISRITAPRPE